MAIALVQSASNSTAAANTVSVTVTSLGSGNLVAVEITVASSKTLLPISVTDNAGNVYYQVLGARRINTDSTGCSIDTWWCPSAIAGATSITVTCNGVTNTGTTLGIFVEEVSGFPAGFSINAVATLNNSGNNTVLNGPTNTTTGAATTGVFITSVAMALGNSITGLDATDTNFTLVAALGNPGGAAYYIPTVDGTYKAIWDRSPTGEFTINTVTFGLAKVPQFDSYQRPQFPVPIVELDHFAELQPLNFSFFATLPAPPSTPDFNSWEGSFPPLFESPPSNDYLLDHNFGFFGFDIVLVDGFATEENVLPADLSQLFTDYLQPQDYGFLTFLNPYLPPLRSYQPIEQPLPDVTLFNTDYINPQQFGWLSYLNPSTHPHGNRDPLFYKRRRFL